ncbi:MAG: hypothetical protein JJT77_09000 [Crocinitomicaceae bacterium]|nr:hypothetical protein [Crocinitomicaceae bacterium]
MSSDRWRKMLWAIPLINIVYGLINVFQLGAFLPLVPFEDVLMACLFLIVAIFLIQKNKALQWTSIFALLLAILHLLKSYVFWESSFAFDWYEIISPFIIILLLVVLMAYWWKIQLNAHRIRVMSWAVLLGWAFVLVYFFLSVLLAIEYYHAINYFLLAVILLVENWKKPISIEKMAILLATLLFLTNKLTYIWL